MIQVYEKTIKVFLLRDIKKDEALECISKVIDSSICKTEELEDLHIEQKFKNYSYNSLYKLERDGVYKGGNIYSFMMRTVDPELSKHIDKTLVNMSNRHMKVLTVSSRKLKLGHIEKLYSITPVVIKTEQGYWRYRISLEEFEKRLKENLVKKYNDYFQDEIDEDFELFERIELDNKKPIASKYKDISILGDKLTIYISDDERAQALAKFAIGAGIAEMNSRGFGYVNYKYVSS